MQNDSYKTNLSDTTKKLEASLADLESKTLEYETASANLEAKDRIIADLSDQCTGHEMSIEKLQSAVKSVTQVNHLDNCFTLHVCLPFRAWIGASHFSVSSTK